VLTLAGADTLAHYQQVLATLTYRDSAAQPNPSSRNVAVVVNDGTQASLPAVSTVAFAPTLDVDASGGVPLAFSDGDLILGYLFRPSRGAPLQPFVSAQATRTEPQIETYLQGLVTANTLDIDGDGVIRSFTDGDLILAYLFGLRGVTPCCRLCPPPPRARFRRSRPFSMG